MIAARISIGVVLVILGAFFLVVARDKARREDAYQSWMAVPAVIVHARVVRDHVDGQSRRREVTAHKVEVSYRYVVAGQTYTGDYYGADNRWLDIGGAREAIADLTPGATTTCYVDPGAPTSSMLHIDGSIYVPMCYGLAGLCFVLLYCIAGVPGVRQIGSLLRSAAAWNRRKKAPPPLSSVVPPRATARRRRRP